MSHSDATGWKCLDCYRVFETKASWQRHLSNSQKRGACELKEYVCKLCGRDDFKDSHAISTHMSKSKLHGRCAKKAKRCRAADIKGTTCLLCGRTFATREKALIHVQNSRKKGKCQVAKEELRYCCRYCGAEFGSRSSQHKHEMYCEEYEPDYCYIDKKITLNEIENHWT